MGVKLILILTTIWLATSSTAFEFFDKKDFEVNIPYGRNWNEQPQKCFNFPFASRQKLSSFRAKTSCIIFYSQTLCQGQSIKLDEDASDLSQLVGNLTHDNFDNRAVSFRHCDEDEGGDHVDVELFEAINYQGVTLPYSDICKCISIPAGNQGFRSLNNHHHCIRLFTSDNCDFDDEHVDIFPGISSISADLSSLPIFGRVKSMRPCTEPPQCFRFSGELFQVAISEPTDGSKNSETYTSDFFSMSARTIFYNNGSATVIQEYSARKEVKEVIELHKIKFNRKMKSWSTEEQTEKGVNVGVGYSVGLYGLGIKAGVTNTVVSAYSDLCDVSTQTSEKYFSETSTEFSLSQEIEVGPCTKYDVDSMIRVVSGYPLVYTVYFRFRGEYAGQRMTADELQDELRSMQEYSFNNTVDEYTVIAFASSTIKATFGVDTEIRGEGSRIAGCFY